MKNEAFDFIKMGNTWQENINFIKDRMFIQSGADYNPIQEETQHTERQYYHLDLENEQAKLNILIDIMKNAIKGALVSRGKNKNSLKAKCPPMDTPEAAAWQALMNYANPYKVGFGHMMFMSPRNKGIFNWVDNMVKVTKLDVRSMDRDRAALENMGVW